jgi:hypothetical protein
MRDPDLIVRAQRAATALESAWCHWRNVHGLAAEPPPAVSSYVGYSLDAPWGEARIVFGICAEEAEQLAALLERHDCVGPVHASVTARPFDGAGSNGAHYGSSSGAGSRGSAGSNGVGSNGVGSTGAGSNGAGSNVAAGGQGRPGASGLLRVPAPAPASAGQQPLSASAVGSRLSEPLPPHRGSARGLTAPSPLTEPLAQVTADAETPIARAATRALEAAMASKRTSAPATTPGTPTPSPGREATSPGMAAGDAASRDPDGREPPGGPPAAADGANRELAGRESPGDRPAAGAGAGSEPAGREPYAGSAIEDAIRPDSGGQQVSGHVGQAHGGGREASDGPGPAQPDPTGSRAAPPTDGGPDARPVGEADPAPDGPEVVAFRLKRPLTAAEHVPEVRGPGADPSGTDDTVQTPAPGRLPDTSRDRVTSAAAHADAATWVASEVPGQAAATDTAV